MKQDYSDHGTAPTRGADTTQLLQGKRWSGTSVLSIILAQYLRTSGLEVRWIDTDPVNQTCHLKRSTSGPVAPAVAGWRVDGAASIRSSKPGSRTEVLSVLDDGASTFIPLWNQVRPLMHYANRHLLCAQ